tara:strand:+ start:2735 stop:2959 length:225 start_codon:yes stop_codon:yes gene_type:complete
MSLKRYDKVEWIREFGTVGNWRVEKMGKRPDARYGYLLSNTQLTYLSVNRGPFDSPEDRDDNILKDIYKREKKQ